MKKADRLLAALRIGPVRNLGGGIIIDVNGKSLRMNGADMYIAVQDIFRMGFRVERTDSGGRPTWELK